MAVVGTRLVVDAEGRVSVATPLPAGEYAAEISVADELSDVRPQSRLRYGDFIFPTFDLGPWPDGIRLDREEVYGDDGR